MSTPPRPGPPTRLVGGDLGVGPDRKAIGIELNASYLRAATSGVVTAACPPVRRGRTLDTFLIDVRDDQGRATASGRLTCMILPT